MPWYEYSCPKCGNDFDKIVSHYDTTKQEVCPKCGTPSSFTIKDRKGTKFLFNYQES